MPNHRFRDEGNGLTSEKIAHQTQLFYDPTTQQARAIFNGSSYLYLHNRYVPFGTDTDILHVDFADKFTELVGRAGDLDPVTGADLSQVSVYGMMVLMKRAYDTYFNKREEDRLAQIAEAERMAAEAEAARLAELEAQQNQTGTEGPALPAPEPTPEDGTTPAPDPAA